MGGEEAGGGGGDWREPGSVVGEASGRLVVVAVAVGDGKAEGGEMGRRCGGWGEAMDDRRWRCLARRRPTARDGADGGGWSARGGEVWCGCHGRHLE